MPFQIIVHMILHRNLASGHFLKELQCGSESLSVKISRCSTLTVHWSTIHFRCVKNDIFCPRMIVQYPVLVIWEIVFYYVCRSSKCWHISLRISKKITSVSQLISSESLMLVGASFPSSSFVFESLNVIIGYKHSGFPWNDKLAFFILRNYLLNTEAWVSIAHQFFHIKMVCLKKKKKAERSAQLHGAFPLALVCSRGCVHASHTTHGILKSVCSRVAIAWDHFTVSPRAFLEETGSVSMAREQQWGLQGHSCQQLPPPLLLASSVWVSTCKRQMES